MNSQKKSFALKIILSFALIGFYSIAIVMTKHENDKELKEKLFLKEKLSLRRNVLLNLNAEIQKLQDERRISTIAKEKFNLIKNFEGSYTIEVDYDEFEKYKAKIKDLK